MSWQPLGNIIAKIAMDIEQKRKCNELDAKPSNIPVGKNIMDRGPGSETKGTGSD